LTRKKLLIEYCYQVVGKDRLGFSSKV
jgi:hypothetical protein